MKLEAEPFVQLQRINVYKCERCRKTYTSLNQFNKHVKWHDLMLDMLNVQVLKHVLSAQVELDKDKIFECGDCTRGFLELTEYSLHQLQHSNGTIFNSNGANNDNDDRFIKKFQCDKCDLKFVAESTLIAHSQVHIQCPHICECGISYYSKKDFIGHRKLVHPQAYDWKPKIEYKGRKEKVEIKSDPEDRDTKPGIRPRLKAKLIIKSERKPKPIAVSKSKTKKKGTKTNSKSGNGITINNLDIKIERKDGKFLCPTCGKALFSKAAILQHIRAVHDRLRPYECTICPKMFTQSHALKLHLKRHAGLKEFPCHYCQKSFYSNGALELHERVHTGVKPHECSYCGKPFADPSALNRHIRIHTGYHPYKCDNCPKTFSDLSGLRRHKLMHERKKEFDCKICDKSFYTLSDLKNHDARVHVRKKHFECDHCGKRFTMKPYLVFHIQGSHMDTNLKCSECERTFTRKVYLDLHFNRVHKQIKKHECKGCGKYFFLKSIMEKHYKSIHSKILYYECNDCFKRCSSKNLLKRHILKKHLAFNCYLCRKSFPCKSELREHKLKGCEKCSICNKGFPSISMRNDHFKIHLNKKKYYCAHCGKRFCHRASIVKHLAMVHNTSEKTHYECDYCGEQFPLKSKLKYHICKYHMINIYCNICHKSFYNDSELQRHKKEQKDCGPTMVNCDICGKIMNSKSLEKHLVVHNRSKTFKCDICRQVFIWRSCIVRHMKLVHGF